MIMPAASHSWRKSPPQSHPGESRSSGRLPVFLISIALLSLLVGVFGVFYWLPNRIASSSSANSAHEVLEATDASATKRAPSAESDIEDLDAEQLARAKEAAADALRDFMRRQKALDEKAVSEWADEPYSEALENASAGDALFQNQQFEQAAQVYQLATATLDSLVDRSDEVLEKSLTAGEQALEEPDPAKAKMEFALALKIDPHSEAARTGLAQAEIVQKVQNLLGSGLEHEERNDLAFAHVDYSEAVNLAPDDSGARAALTRVEGKIAEQKFNRAMSDGLNALHRNELKTARSAVKLALAFKPDSAEAQNVLAQIAETARLQQIANYQKHAKDLESDERWKEAAEQYMAILAIAPNVVFAKEGKERSHNRAALSHKLDIYLSEPGRLASKQSHNDASTLLKAANQIDNKGPKLTSQVLALETLVKAAGTPVPVQLRSDNLTEVTVYKVGALGKFENVELELRPGKYTVVGTRTGYRDVRKDLVVAIDKRPEAIVIRCEEKI